MADQDKLVKRRLSLAARAAELSHAVLETVWSYLG